jgi:anti-sigma-K factor RskA
MVLEEHVTDLLPAYALGCLDEDEDEAGLVTAHLAVCPVCSAELRSYQAVGEALPLAISMSEPPPAIKQRLIAQVNQARVTPAQPQPTWWQRLEQGFRRISPAWGLASLVLIVALLVSNLLLLQQVSRLGAAAPQPVAARIVTMQHTEAAPDATGVLVLSKNGEYGTLMVDHLPPLGQDQQYQLWLIKDGKRTSGGVFSVNWDGYGSLEVTSPEWLANYSALGITIEPTGGSPGPTGAKVLGGNL